MHMCITRLDKDSSGHLDRDELRQLLLGLSAQMKPDEGVDDAVVADREIEEAINEMDWSGDEEVSFEEFEAWWIRRQARYGSGDSQMTDDGLSVGEEDAEKDEEMELLERKITLRVKADIEAAESRLEAKLDGVNARLDSLGRMLESMMGREP